MFGIFLQELREFKAEIAVIYTGLADACHKFKLILTFITQILIGSCVVRCAFSLASGKYDCPERVLRTSTSINQ